MAVKGLTPSCQLDMGKTGEHEMAQRVKPPAMRPGPLSLIPQIHIKVNREN